MPRPRRRGNPLVRIGVLLVIIGFGSTVLHSASSYQFTLLAWADGMQPYVGIVVGLTGVLLLAMPFIIVSARQGSSGTTASPTPPGAAFAQPSADGGFPAPQGGQPAGFPAPAAWEQNAFGQSPVAPQSFPPGQFDDGVSQR
jgi:hypothetical protein